MSCLDLAGELALLGCQLPDAAGDSAQREQRAAQLGIPSACGPGRGEAVQQPRPGQRPQLAHAAARAVVTSRSRSWQSPARFAFDRSFAGGHQRPQRLALAACARRRRPLAG